MWMTWRVMLNRLRGVFTGATGDACVFSPRAEGSGIFGKWALDEYGLPAYRYTLDQWRDPRARYPNTENLNRRDHWHQIGNDRITALVSNEGFIQVVIGDRGGVFLNRFEARDREGQPDPTVPPLALGARMLDGMAQVLLALAR